MVQQADILEYEELAIIADEIFAKCEDDPACIARKLDGLKDNIRNELITSDLLNAFQVFWYFFREYPGDMASEILMFHPAGVLIQGISLGEIGIFHLVFQVKGDRAEIIVYDDIQEIGRYSGRKAYRNALSFINEGC